ncbi:MAG: hypothetical protein LIP12_07785 [Clostridiales bacterium]|nr:hypothetical protein [Clostridiales bacterium]
MTTRSRAPSRNWTAVGEVIIYCGLLPQAIDLRTLSDWYRHMHFTYTLDPDKAEHIRPYAAFGRAMWQHYCSLCKYDPRTHEPLYVAKALNPDSDADYAALTEAIIYSACGYKVSDVPRGEARQKELKETAYALADAMHEVAESVKRNYAGTGSMAVYIPDDKGGYDIRRPEQ